MGHGAPPRRAAAARRAEQRHPDRSGTPWEDGKETRKLNDEETEAAKEKLGADQGGVRALDLDRPRAHRPAGAASTTTATTTWCRAPSTARTCSCPAPAAPSSSARTRSAASGASCAAGSTYLAHCVGAGKTFVMAAASWSSAGWAWSARRMMVVPGHCLAQASREFLLLYPNARILVADETNFAAGKRARFLARAATANWDCIIITHAASSSSPPRPVRAGHGPGRRSRPTRSCWSTRGRRRPHHAQAHRERSRRCWRPSWRRWHAPRTTC